MIDRLHKRGVGYLSRAAVNEKRASEQLRSPLSHHSEQPTLGAGDDRCRHRR